MDLHRSVRIYNGDATKSQIFSGQKTVVTGASGFLGSHLCKHLSASGAKIHAISRTARTLESRSLHWWQGDMTDIARVRSLLNEIKPDVIFHLSGLSTAITNFELVLPTFHSLLTSTVNVLTVSAEIGCRRVVLTGSLTEPRPNESEPIPSSPYAAAKWASTAYGRMFYKLYRTPVVIVRPFMTFGPGQDPRKLIPYVVLSFLRGKAPKLSSGRREADWIYIDDVIDGLLAAAQAPDVEGCTLELGSGILTSIGTVVQHLVDLTGSSIEPLFGALAERPFEQERPADIAYAYTKLAWKPSTSLVEGLKSTVNWYRLRAREAQFDALSISQ